jgi:hypothetical protein
MTSPPETALALSSEKQTLPSKEGPPEPPQPIALDDSTDEPGAKWKQKQSSKGETMQNRRTGPWRPRYMDRRVAKHFGLGSVLWSVDEFYSRRCGPMARDDTMTDRPRRF